jgi:hypothetical protein
MKITIRDNKVLYAIVPTDYQDYDLIAIGRPSALRTIAKSGDIIRSSLFGCSLIVIDIFDTIREANREITRLKKINEGLSEGLK